MFMLFSQKLKKFKNFVIVMMFIGLSCTRLDAQNLTSIDMPELRPLNPTLLKFATENHTMFPVILPANFKNPRGLKTTIKYSLETLRQEINRLDEIHSVNVVNRALSDKCENVYIRTTSFSDYNNSLEVLKFMAYIAGVELYNNEGQIPLENAKMLLKYYSNRSFSITDEDYYLTDKYVNMLYVCWKIYILPEYLDLCLPEPYALPELLSPFGKDEEINENAVEEICKLWPESYEATYCKLVYQSEEMKKSLYSVLNKKDIEYKEIYTKLKGVRF